jgi:hypothetical protein
VLKVKISKKFKFSFTCWFLSSQIFSNVVSHFFRGVRSNFTSPYVETSTQNSPEWRSTDPAAVSRRFRRADQMLSAKMKGLPVISRPETFKASKLVKLKIWEKKMKIEFIFRRIFYLMLVKLIWEWGVGWKLQLSVLVFCTVWHQTLRNWFHSLCSLILLEM